MAELPRLHTPEELGAMVGKSGWWFKEQCRRRRIPFIRVAGAYRFTDSHVAEILALLEERPEVGQSSGGMMPRRKPQVPAGPTAPLLRSRLPRRARKALTDP